ncbi:MAG: hypothetical protein RDV41_12315 [Planctomycetota bacterium]|nr:hypothetical protein [Planctomycetota bacterium]
MLESSTPQERLAALKSLGRHTHDVYFIRDAAGRGLRYSPLLGQPR